MEKIVVVGPFNGVMKQALEQAMPEGFSLEYINSREEYGSLETADYASRQQAGDVTP